MNFQNKFYLLIFWDGSITAIWSRRQTSSSSGRGAERNSWEIDNFFGIILGRTFSYFFDKEEMRLNLIGRGELREEVQISAKAMPEVSLMTVELLERLGERAGCASGCGCGRTAFSS